jgi:hypothetical protein
MPLPLFRVQRSGRILHIECKSLKPSPDVDAPANVIAPETLTDRVVKFAHLDSEIVDPVRAELATAPAYLSSSRPG